MGASTDWEATGVLIFHGTSWTAVAGRGPLSLSQCAEDPEHHKITDSALEPSFPSFLLH